MCTNFINMNMESRPHSVAWCAQLLAGERRVRRGVVGWCERLAGDDVKRQVINQTNLHF
jgi:hypothetical protein